MISKTFSTKFDLNKWGFFITIKAHVRLPWSQCRVYRAHGAKSELRNKKVRNENQKKTNTCNRLSEKYKALNLTGVTQINVIKNHNNIS